MNEHRDETHRVLAQADALMGRHRVFIAGAGAPPIETASLTTDEEDIPVLTEIVDDRDTLALPGPNPVEDLLVVQRQQLEQTIEQWMDQRLPEEVLRVMDGVSDQLIGTLVSKMRAELLPQLLAATYPPANDDDGTTLESGEAT